MAMTDIEVQTIADLILSGIIKSERFHNEHRVAERQDLLAREFGRRHGWKWRHDTYGAQHLFGKRPHYWERDMPPHTDHPCGFYACRMPMAIVSQPYINATTHREEMADWAAATGLCLTFPDFPSWYYPTSTTLCVFTREPLLPLGTQP